MTVLPLRAARRSSAARRRSGPVARALSLYAALGLVTLVVLAALTAPWLGLRDPLQQDLSAVLLPPGSSGAHGSSLLGTDPIGRDVLARLVFGIRPLLTIIVLAVSLAAAFGLLYGLVAGFSRGRLGQVAMRIADVQLSIPPVILAIVFAAAMQPGVKSVVIAIALVTWPQYARVIRSEVLRLRTTEFVLLARTAGLGRGQILRRHIAPNVLNSFVVLVTLELSSAVIFASALSFLGVGVQEPTPDWGNMLASGTAYMQTSWWLVVLPGLAITALILSINVIGDRLRDFADPKSRNR